MFDFGTALSHLRAGKRVQRTGWNGKMMFLTLASTGTAKMAPESSVMLEPFIAMWTAQRNWVPWLASQSDVLASDWQIAPHCTPEQIANGECPTA